MDARKILALAVVLASPVQAGGPLDWLDSEPEKAPEPIPYQAPTFDGSVPDWRQPLDPLQHPRALDADGLARAVERCYPARSNWSAEVSLEGRWGEYADAAESGVQLADEWIGIVAKVPLWSSSERDREREREYMRRTANAQLIGGLLLAVAERDRHLREWGLYRSLEARSRARVAQGYAPTDEQIGWMEKTAAAHSAAISATAQIEQARLSLVEQCRPAARGAVNAYILRATARKPQEAASAVD